MTHPPDNTPVLPPEAHAAIRHMRNWVYVNIACLLITIAGGFVVNKFEHEAVIPLMIPAVFFIYGIALCHTVEMRMKRGSIAFARLARVTTQGTIAFSAVAIVGLSIGITAAMLKHHPREVAFETPFLLLFVSVIYPAVCTNRVLAAAIPAMPQTRAFGFPVEITAPEPPASPS